MNEPRERARAGPKEVGKAQSPEQGTATAESVRFRRPLDLILMETNRCLNPNPRLASARSIFDRMTHGVPIWNGTATARRLPSGPGSERANTPRSDSVACQRALVGDSLDDE